MVEDTKQIETGVDKLIKLIEKKNKVSLNDAAKELAIPKEVLEEWVNFLEEKELITVEYKFTTPYLVKREITKKEIEQKTKEFVGRKEGFIRKVETTLTTIDAERDALGNLKQEFDVLSKGVEGDVKSVENDIVILERYETLKRGIDKEIIKQQKDFQDNINQLNKTVLEKAKCYEAFVGKIRNLEIKLYQDKTRTDDMMISQENIKENLIHLVEVTNVIQGEIKKQDSMIGEDKTEIKHLEKAAEKAKKDFTKGVEKINKLIDKSKDQEKAIITSQQDILKKVFEHSKHIDSSVNSAKKAKARLDSFFSKKSEINNIVTRINNEVNGLDSELKELMNEVELLQLSTKAVSVKTHMGEVEKKFKHIKDNEKRFEDEVYKLTRIIKK